MNETIAAIATPPGSGAIGIVRVSGPGSRSIAAAVFHSSRPEFTGFQPYRLHHGRLRTSEGAFLDEALVVFMPQPNSFTGEDIVEFHCHGGMAILRGVMEECLALGAQPAGPGEFSKRAFLNGRMDLARAEAVMELVNAPSETAVRLAGSKLEGGLSRRVDALRQSLEALRVQLCVAVDFPEDEVECLAPAELNAQLEEAEKIILDLAGNYERVRYWRDGALVVLAGQVNAGKSSLMNAILGINRAIVADIPGTTRDYLEESVHLDGLPVRLVDTAGLRDFACAVEGLGIERSREIISRADLVLLVIDADLGPGAEDLALLEHDVPLLVAANKMDLVSGKPAWFEVTPWKDKKIFSISAKNGDGLPEMLAAVRETLVGQDALEEDVPAPNLRQHAALVRAGEELQALRADLALGVPYDVLSVRLDMACHMLAEITGEMLPEEILNAVFDRFCIGK
jgi:tRNA modification GTPase